MTPASLDDGRRLPRPSVGGDPRHQEASSLSPFRKTIRWRSLSRGFKHVPGAMTQLIRRWEEAICDRARETLKRNDDLKKKYRQRSTKISRQIKSNNAWPWRREFHNWTSAHAPMIIAMISFECATWPPRSVELLGNSRCHPIDIANLRYSRVYILDDRTEFTNVDSRCKWKKKRLIRFHWSAIFHGAKLVQAKLS